MSDSSVRPMDYIFHQAPLPVRFPGKNTGWVAIPSSGYLPDQDRTCVSHLTRRILYCWATEAPILPVYTQYSMEHTTTQDIPHTYICLAVSAVSSPLKLFNALWCFAIFLIWSILLVDLSGNSHSWASSHSFSQTTGALFIVTTKVTQVLTWHSLLRFLTSSSSVSNYLIHHLMSKGCVWHNYFEHDTQTNWVKVICYTDIWKFCVLKLTPHTVSITVIIIMF